MKKHKNIMIQGTGSSVGKTLIVAGLCRIFAQDGYRVSPFKSQNMALNSFVDIEGLELSRGTVIQAEAGYEIPRAFMNPILLKPNSDNNSQVIINGKVAYTADAKNYFSHSKELKKIALETYKNNIENNFDIAVLEGGGSPAEINLREYDLVNMGMAELIDSPVILVGNIDIGGVFASIYGTVMLLDENDRKRIKGYIINKFRGDSDLLKPAIEILDKKKPLGLGHAISCAEFCLLNGSTISFSVTSPALLEIYFVPPAEHPANPITDILSATGKIAFLNLFINYYPPNCNYV